MSDKSALLGPEFSTLFPQRVLAVRRGWRRHLLNVSPFSIRQLASLHTGANPLTIATGKPARWFRKVHPEDYATIRDTIKTINDCSEQQFSEALGKDDAGKPMTFSRAAALLISSGHSPDRIWDYTPAQFSLYLREALANRQQDLGARAALDAHTLSAIAAAFSKEGAEGLRKFVALLTRE